jgi:hypothetical protein
VGLEGLAGAAGEERPWAEESSGGVRGECLTRDGETKGIGLPESDMLGRLDVGG